METIVSFEFLLVAIGGFVMLAVMLKAISQSAAVAASTVIAARRKDLEFRRAADAAAEAAGRAAALEPLALNADGSIEEPILATLETQE